MDIRNFFGGKHGSSSQSKSSSENDTNHSRKKIESKKILENDKVNIIQADKENSDNERKSPSALNEESQITTTAIDEDIKADITWIPGKPVPYSAIVKVFEEISNLSGRLDKESSFERLFRAVACSTPEDLDVIVYIACNEVAPVYGGMELGIGDSLLVKAVCEATGRNRDAVEEAYEREGDLGTVALMSRASQRTLSFAAKPQPLSSRYVLEQFRLIALTKGDKAQTRKVNIIKSLMVRCQASSCEAKYIVRALQGKLRIGTAKQTVLVALAHALLSLQLVLPTIKAVVWENAKEKLMKYDSENKNEAEIDSGSSNQSTLHVNKQEEAHQDFVSVWEKLSPSETPEAVKLREFILASSYNNSDLLKSIKSMEDSRRATALASSVQAALPKESRLLYSEIAVKRAYSECPNIPRLVKQLLEQPLYNLHHGCRLDIGIPVAPMLAKPTKQIGEVLSRLSGLAFTMEYKYDGERAQVHLLPDGTVKIFSRNSEDNSEKYPDLRDVVRIAKVEGVDSCIIDAEVVAYDREQKCLLPFQILSTRKRKVDAGEEDAQKVKVILQVFDLLYLNGKSLLRESLRLRRTLLHLSFQHTEGLLHFASGADHVEDGDTAPIENFLQEACVAQCEGLMVKTLDNNASYEPSKRSLNWLKLKKDYIDGMGVCDSVDLVPIGGYYGRGKRVNTYGAYLMACYDPEKDEFQSVCKVGTGFKDEDLSRLHTLMQQHIIPSRRRPINYNVTDALTPDDWFDTSQVWELQAADLSKSSTHTGGMGRVEASNGNRGIGLRFPRFLRERSDKNGDQATSAEQIVDLYYSQSGLVAATSGNNNNDDEEEWL